MQISEIAWKIENLAAVAASRVEVARQTGAGWKIEKVLGDAQFEWASLADAFAKGYDVPLADVERKLRNADSYMAEAGDYKIPAQADTILADIA